ncbi:hypothetical protein [Demequina globuliformis]|uniref:hypothetical protein n=1 Tax=Demequina globuliformis TaxID=676202 RepID=UPI0007854C1C|nr:hypothetical protein [Demequina globuliformis]
MTQNPTPPAAPAGAPQPMPTPAAEAPAKNRMGLIALITAAAGFLFACIPGALIVGWILLPVGFILGIVAVTRKGQKKGMGIAAIIVSVVGTIVGVIVFLAVAATAVSDAFEEAGGGDTVVVTEDEADAGAEPSAAAEAGDEDAAPQEATAEAGTRDNPYAFGDVIENNDWRVELTDFTADAAADIAAANEFNDEAPEGSQWVIADVAATYLGEDTGSTFELSFDYVTADGTVVGAHDSFVMGLEPDFDSLAELYTDATEDGRIAYLVPDSLDGLMRVTPGLFGDDVFFALPTQ